MILLDILSIITDETKVVLFEDGEEVAEYNGKNDIPAEYNNRIVKAITGGYYQIDIDI